MFTLTTIFYTLFSQGTFQNYLCDQCEKWLPFRKHAKLHIPTRRTLCKSCWNSTRTAEVVEKTSKSAKQ